VAARLVTALGVGCAAWMPAGAAEVDFRPTLMFGIFHDGNIAVTGDATANGDDVGAVSVELVVDRTTPDDTLSFAYRPTYVAYRKNDGLNYFGQSVRMSYAHAPSRAATYAFDLDASRTERQGVRPTDPADTTTFVPRSLQTHVTIRGHGRHEARRNIVDWELRGTLDDFSQAHQATGTQPTVCTTDAECDDGNACTDDTCAAGLCAFAQNHSCDLQGSTGARALTTWQYAVTENHSVGLGLVFETFWYEVLPTTYNESLGLVGESSFGRFTTMTYAAGVCDTTSSGVSDTNVVGNLHISRAFSEDSTLAAEVRRSASQGSGLGGVSIDQGGYLEYGYSPNRRGVTAAIIAAYWKREPPDQAGTSGTPSTTTISTNATLGWNFNRFLSLNLNHLYSDQSSSSPTTLDTRYSSYGLHLSWAIRGREGTRR